MPEEELLDHNVQDSHSQKLWIAIKWWESQRFTYNLIVGVCGLISIFLLLYSNIDSLKILILILSIIYATIANIAYCSGWMLEILILYYFDSQFTPNTRRFLWILGVFFSVFVTLGLGFFASLVLGVGLGD